MTAPPFNAGAFVLGAPTSPRALVRHADLLAAYADGLMAEKDETREAYLSHFAFGPELQAHHRAQRNSVAGFVGPCWCRWLALDIDRPDLVDALADARRLVAQDARRWHRQRALDDVEIAVTDARCGRAHEHLSGTRRVDRDLLDHERSVAFAHDGGSHRRLLDCDYRRR